MKTNINKEIICKLSVLIMFFFCAMIPVHADTGPKPSLSIQCEGFPENSYVTVLSTVSDYGPNSPWDSKEHDDDYFATRTISREVYEAISEKARQEREAGTPCYFWGVVTKCSEEYLFGYWPPEEFKILIYMEDSGQFLLSEETYTRKAFRTHYQCTYSEDGLIIKDVSSAFPSFSGILARIILTIVIEYLVSMIFMKHTSKSRIVLILANIITQLFLNGILSAATMKYGSGTPVYLISLLIAELVIIASEWLIYRKWIPREQLKNPLICSAAANVSSYVLGLLAMSAIPVFPM